MGVNINIMKRILRMSGNRLWKSKKLYNSRKIINNNVDNVIITSAEVDIEYYRKKGDPVYNVEYSESSFCIISSGIMITLDFNAIGNSYNCDLKKIDLLISEFESCLDVFKKNKKSYKNFAFLNTKKSMISNIIIDANEYRAHIDIMDCRKYTSIYLYNEKSAINILTKFIKEFNNFRSAFVKAREEVYKQKELYKKYELEKKSK